MCPACVRCEHPQHILCFGRWAMLRYQVTCNEGITNTRSGDVMTCLRALAPRAWRWVPAVVAASGYKANDNHVVSKADATLLRDMWA